MIDDILFSVLVHLIKSHKKKKVCASSLYMLFESQLFPLLALIVPSLALATFNYYMKVLSFMIMKKKAVFVFNYILNKLLKNAMDS